MIGRPRPGNQLLPISSKTWLNVKFPNEQIVSEILYFHFPRNNSFLDATIFQDIKCFLASFERNWYKKPAGTWHLVLGLEIGGDP